MPADMCVKLFVTFWHSWAIYDSDEVGHPLSEIDDKWTKIDITMFWNAEWQEYITLKMLKQGECLTYWVTVFKFGIINIFNPFLSLT